MNKHYYLFILKRNAWEVHGTQLTKVKPFMYMYMYISWTLMFCSIIIIKQTTALHHPYIKPQSAKLQNFASVQIREVEYCACIQETLWNEQLTLLRWAQRQWESQTANHVKPLVITLTTYNLLDRDNIIWPSCHGRSIDWSNHTNSGQCHKLATTKHRQLAN